MFRAMREGLTRKLKMIEMTIHPNEPAQPNAGREMSMATALWNGVEHAAKSATGAIMVLARTLTNAGCPDQPWRALRGGVVALHGNSIARLAVLTVSETDTAGPRFKKYRPYQGSAQMETLEAA